MKTAARRDRLLTLLYRGSTTVPAVARTLGVSERTVYRDLATLRDAGHDIRATPGPGGGVRVAPNSRPRAVHFEVAEIVGLALSVAILKATPHLPFGGSAEAALDRARMALSPERQRAMKRLERRILIGAPASERVEQSLGTVDDTLLSVFERCFTGNLSMTFDYVDAAGTPSSRHVECIALVLHAPIWYILSWDLEKDARRLFRMDRIAAPQCGDALAENHPLADVLPKAELATGVWNRRPIG
ncbi:MAG: WYL domain-containing protein [Myxococcota bacterium]